MKRHFRSVVLSLALGTASYIYADNSFNVIDFPGAASTQSWGINSRGDIVGFYVASDNTSHGFLENGGNFTKINYPGSVVTLVNGVSSRGDLVGEYGMTATGPHRGFLLGADGVFTPVDYRGATASSAIGISARGDIVGVYSFADNVSHGFLLSNGKLTKIDYPGASGTAVNGISPTGDIVGGYSIGGVSHGFVLSNGAYQSFDYPNAAFTTATGENAAGEVVGRYRDAAGVNHGFVMKEGQFTSVDFPSATFTGLTAIDAAGNITGRATVGGVTHGFLMASGQKPGRYRVRDLGVLGAAPAQPFFITNSGLVSGAAGMPDGSLHAVLWARGTTADLGTPGLNSMSFAVTDSGMAVGQTEVALSDPNGEDFCGFAAVGLPVTGARCLPFTSQYGAMTLLRTLGGANGAANMVNSRGQVAGVAETTTLDPSCPAPQKFQFKAVLWENGNVAELPAVGGDLISDAFAINENGQVAGASGSCATFNPNVLTNLQPLHAVLWETGKVTDLGNLGGTGHGFGNLALNLNNRGQVVGTSDLAGDQKSHAFAWSKVTGMEDLGVLEGDVNSVAVAVADDGTMVGFSFDEEFNPRAWVRRQGVMTDLNSLIPANSPLYLLVACSINARGEITGLAVDPNSGDLHGYVVSPVDDLASLESRPRVKLSGAAREKLGRMKLGGFGLRKEIRK